MVASFLIWSPIPPPLRPTSMKVWVPAARTTTTSKNPTRSTRSTTKNTPRTTRSTTNASWVVERVLLLLGLVVRQKDIKLSFVVEITTEQTCPGGRPPPSPPPSETKASPPSPSPSPSRVVHPHPLTRREKALPLSPPPPSPSSWVVLLLVWVLGVVVARVVHVVVVGQIILVRLILVVVGVVVGVWEHWALLWWLLGRRRN